jgi:transcriptional regulator
VSFYIPKHFRVDDRDALVAFVQANAFATLVTAGADGLDVSHVPLHLVRAADGAMKLLGHVARANTHWKSLEAGRETLAIFNGPHAYVSPGWYANHPSVPTWNYATVHARGTARLMDDEALKRLIDTLSAYYESGREKPWRMADLTAEYVDTMVRAIVGFEIEVASLEGKFKLSQNRKADDIARVIAALEAEGEGATAALMRAYAPRESR